MLNCNIIKECKLIQIRLMIVRERYISQTELEIRRNVG